MNEEDGSVQVCTTLSAYGNTERNFTVSLVTSNGTGIPIIIIRRGCWKYLLLLAKGNFDYTSVHFNKTFVSGSMNNDIKCMDISIINDGALERDQHFALILSTSDADVLIARNTTVITIIDNDGKSL